MVLNFPLIGTCFGLVRGLILYLVFVPDLFPDWVTPPVCNEIRYKNLLYGCAARAGASRAKYVDSYGDIFRMPGTGCFGCGREAGVLRESIGSDTGIFVLHIRYVRTDSPHPATGQGW